MELWIIPSDLCLGRTHAHDALGRIDLRPFGTHPEKKKERSRGFHPTGRKMKMLPG